MSTEMKRKLNVTKAQKAAGEIDVRYFKSAKWNDVYQNEQELIDDLKKVVIPENNVAPHNLFKGYQYIFNFAKYAKNGWKLSDKQMTQCKRLAVEIKKASVISTCYE